MLSYSARAPNEISKSKRRKQIKMKVLGFI
jgi:hypothetical protein